MTGVMNNDDLNVNEDTYEYRMRAVMQNSVLGQNGANGRRLRGILTDFLKRNTTESWDGLNAETSILKIMPAETDGVVYIYRRDVLIVWDSKSHKVLDVNDMALYPSEVPFYMPDDVWNRYCGLCVLGALVAHDKSVDDFASYIHCSKRRALNLIHGEVDLCSYEVVGLTKWFDMTADELFLR